MRIYKKGDRVIVHRYPNEGSYVILGDYDVFAEDYIYYVQSEDRPHITGKVFQKDIISVLEGNNILKGML